MATITATESITLDGVMQAPGGPDEDRRGGFDHGGWAQPFASDEQLAIMGEGMAATRAMLFGRRTYDAVVGHWLSAPEPNPFGGFLRAIPKWVASRSGAPLAHPASTLLPGEAVDTVARLRGEVDGVISILGSGELVRALHAAGLIDRFVLLVHPITLGSGARLFGDGPRRDLELQRADSTSTGVTILQLAVRGTGARATEPGAMP
ncbi:dihydrofolate reductase family protein [Agrococcus sp. HG114]|uniref:dihydrofolate reductase family protein n=1 Tax=Agrococcus sp. HG114 TaxID=2969757 RepID=UPI00215ADA00|nr:dihydrofolate reductase family protein [Agrococcus sp. HG114]MCR8671673.1 dihydrofolate reductase family protein [Agrococcus sp. HG114]